MKKLKHVRQLDSSGCGIACIAMVMGKTYKEIADTIGEEYCKNYGLSDYAMVNYLEGHGCPVKMLPFPNMFCGHVAIASVPSVNLPRHMHYIVIDTRPGNNKTGDKAWIVLDPQKGNRGKKYYTAKNLHTYCELKIIENLTEPDWRDLQVECYKLDVTKKHRKKKNEKV